MSRRSRAREVALQILYQEDLSGERDPVQEEAFFCARIKSDSIRQFARDLVNGVRTKQLQIDACLIQYAEHWSLSRMPPTDRNILRMGSFELLFGDAPPKVVINEAVELAKRFGTAQSSQFVNGMLDRVRVSSESDGNDDFS